MKGLKLEKTLCNIKRILVVKKRSRYDLERAQFRDLDETTFRAALEKRGSDLAVLTETHKTHTKNTEKLLKGLKSAGFQVDMIDRTTLTEDAVDNCDLLVCAGGDGTFLMGASRIKDRSKLIVGFNTDPTRSAGFLCANPRGCGDYETLAMKLKNGSYSFLYRTRIETKLTGIRAGEAAVEIDQTPQPQFPGCARPDKVKVVSRTLEFLALNEVFIGESLSSQVSHISIEVPGVERTPIKCSGICVSTGTGSTSWHMSINRLSMSKVHKLLEIAGHDKTPQEIKKITESFNSSLKFSPDDPRLFYTLRDVIRPKNQRSPIIPSSSFAASVAVTSKCSSANLVLDGSKAYPFNDGTIAEMTTSNEKSLKTIIFD